MPVMGTVPEAQSWPANTYMSRLPARLREDLIKLGTSRNYPAGSTYRITTEHVVVIESGILLVEHEKSPEAAVSIYCGSGEVVGFEHALSVDQRCAGSWAKAQTAVDAKIITTELFREFMDQSAAERALLAEVIHQSYLERVRRARHTHPITEQTRLFLEEMATRFGIREGNTHTPEGIDKTEMMLDINLTQYDIADAIGVSKASIENALNKLRRSGTIKTGRRWIVVRMPRSDPFLPADLPVAADDWGR